MRLWKFSGLSRRLPDLAIEAVFIVFALLGAFLIEDWRSDRNNENLGKRAEFAIIDELKSNHADLAKKVKIHRALLADIDTKLAISKKDKDQRVNYNFSYEVVLLSTAAWDSARMTLAIQYIPLDSVTSYSSVYRYQKIYEDGQQALVDQLIRLGEVRDTEYVNYAQAFRHRLMVLLEINQDLQQNLQATINAYRT